LTSLLKKQARSSSKNSNLSSDSKNYSVEQARYERCRFEMSKTVVIDCCVGAPAAQAGVLVAGLHQEPKLSFKIV
jgi:hypothetical protein